MKEIDATIIGSSIPHTLWNIIFSNLSNNRLAFSYCRNYSNIFFPYIEPEGYEAKRPDYRNREVVGKTSNAISRFFHITLPKDFDIPFMVPFPILIHLPYICSRSITGYEGASMFDFGDEVYIPFTYKDDNLDYSVSNTIFSKMTDYTAIYKIISYTNNELLLDYRGPNEFGIFISPHSSKKTIVKPKRTYYTGCQMIFDDEFIPLVTTMYKVVIKKGGTSIQGPPFKNFCILDKVFYINPIVFQVNDIVCKFITKRFIPIISNNKQKLSNLISNGPFTYPANYDNCKHIYDNDYMCSNNIVLTEKANNFIYKNNYKHSDINKSIIYKYINDQGSNITDKVKAITDKIRRMY